MSVQTKLIQVNPNNIDQTRFFCYMSKPKSPGFRQKREWLLARFAEGLQIKIIHEEGGRDVGFIEYIPGEYAWRAVYAPEFLVIHCLWVVGKGKGKGYGSLLIKECIEDARRQGKQGVVMISSERIWLAGKQIFLQNGFIEQDQAPPTFQLLVHQFDSGTPPHFPHNWEERQAHFGEGLTIIRTSQCPYIPDAVLEAQIIAQARGIPARLVEFQSAQEVQDYSPSPYGVFGLVYNGRLLSYHFLGSKGFDKYLSQFTEGEKYG